MESRIRNGVIVAATLWLLPVITVGLMGLGLPALGAGIAALIASCVVALRISSALMRLLVPAAVWRPWILTAGVVVAAVAIVQISRLSVFMTDPTRVRFSIVASDPFRIKHCCFSAYAEGARFASEGNHNIYDSTLYDPRQIGPLKVDPFHYPPPFLLLPAALRAVTADFLRLRELWFALQALALASTALGIAVWIGGAVGGYAVFGTALMLTMPQAIFTLQQGNVQITAIPLGVAALAMICGDRLRSGAALLAYVTAAKIFPGVLIVWLVGKRHWRALAWTAGVGLMLTALTVAAFGIRPFRDFIQHGLPAVADASAFPQTELSATAPSNLSVYGITVRLRLLGIDALDQRTGLAVTSVYGVLVVALAAFIGFRMRADVSTTDGRMRTAQIALALLALASFRSPFVGGSYGFVSSLWLMSLLAAESSAPVMVGWLAAMAALSLANWSVPSPAHESTPFTLAASGIIVLAVIGLNVWVGLRSVRQTARPARVATAPLTTTGAA